WNHCIDPRSMLDFLSGKASPRKLRLFATGCVLRAWEVLEDDDPTRMACCRSAVETAERYADGLVSAEAMQQARAAVPQTGGERPPAYPAHRWGIEAALAVTELTPDVAAIQTAECLRRIADFAEAQANVIGVSGLCVVSSRQELARMIDDYRARNLPLGFDWE